MFIVAGEAGMSSRKRPSRDQELRTCLRCMAYALRVCVSLGKGWVLFLAKSVAGLSLQSVDHSRDHGLRNLRCMACIFNPASTRVHVWNPAPT